MAEIFRFSGYYVDCDIAPFSDEETFKYALKAGIDSLTDGNYAWQQLHVEKGEPFEVNGELEKNCDLALLTNHFKHEPKNDYGRPLPKPGEIYKHFKTGNMVTVMGISRHTETEEVTVTYMHDGQLWNRPLDMFMSEVDHKKYPDVNAKWRFAKLPLWR